MEGGPAPPSEGVGNPAVNLEAPGDSENHPLPEESGAAENFASGPMRVGVDIAPGAYRSSGAEGEMCYWSRQATDSPDPALEEIIDFGLVPAGEEITVTIEPSDVLFVSEYCGKWTKVG